MGERKLTLGMKGDDVKSVQKKLIALGYLTGKADGVYGTATESAIRRFQTRNRAYVRRHLRRGHGQGAVQQHRD